jgi:hypothetical protein
MQRSQNSLPTLPFLSAILAIVALFPVQSWSQSSAMSVGQGELLFIENRGQIHDMNGMER